MTVEKNVGDQVRLETWNRAWEQFKGIWLPPPSLWFSDVNLVRHRVQAQVVYEMLIAQPQQKREMKKWRN